jgi:hypothetical protein
VLLVMAFVLDVHTVHWAGWCCSSLLSSCLTHHLSRQVRGVVCGDRCNALTSGCKGGGGVGAGVKGLSTGSGGVSLAAVLVLSLPVLACFQSQCFA